ncbi:MAG: hypothetical protein JNL98_18380 [Bryobacterales bacterium]|nr:hypothetical protein [Bryobacterales bacterium]
MRHGFLLVFFAASMHAQSGLSVTLGSGPLLLSDLPDSPIELQIGSAKRWSMAVVVDATVPGAVWAGIASNSERAVSVRAIPRSSIVQTGAKITIPSEPGTELMVHLRIPAQRVIRVLAGARTLFEGTAERSLIVQDGKVQRTAVGPLHELLSISR